VNFQKSNLQGNFVGSPCRKLCRTFPRHIPRPAPQERNIYRRRRELGIFSLSSTGGEGQGRGGIFVCPQFSLDILYTMIYGDLHPLLTRTLTAPEASGDGRRLCRRGRG
jgi:hypothetical protein